MCTGFIMDENIRVHLHVGGLQQYYLHTLQKELVPIPQALFKS